MMHLMKKKKEDRKKSDFGCKKRKKKKKDDYNKKNTRGEERWRNKPEIFKKWVIVTPKYFNSLLYLWRFL